MQLRFFEAIAEAKDRGALYSALQSLAYELDFERFSLITRVDGERGGRTQVSSLANTPEAFIAEATDPDISMMDPVYRHIVGSNRPLVYTQKTYVDGGAADLWDRQAPYGYKNGISAALSLRGARLIFGLDRPDVLPNNDTALVLLVTTVTSALVYAHDSVEILAGGPPGAAPGLTKQQEAILQLIAEGKSNSVIGELVGLTTHGVNYHVRRIFEKLGISSRSQAVDVANRLRIL